MVAPIGSIGGLSVGSLLQNPSPAPSGGAGSSAGGGFGAMLAHSITSLDAAQAQAAQQTQALATGQSSDLSSVVMSVEQASLEVSLASQVQTKAVQAYQSIFQTTV
jgi:flagellar hook-basal body complex protein FliE